MSLRFWKLWVDRIFAFIIALNIINLQARHCNLMPNARHISITKFKYRHRARGSS
jgi:hypothetical protein